MIEVLWAVFGMTTGAAVLYAALGLTRPADRTYLSFACIMATLAAFVYFERELYTSMTASDAIETVRRQIVAGHALIASILIFVPSYTRVRIPRWLFGAYVGVLAILFVTNLVAPLGLWFSGPPDLHLSRFAGGPYTAVVAPSLSTLQIAHTMYVVGVYGLMFSCAVKVIRRGERQRGVMLGIALTLTIVPHVVDVVRDAVGGDWPNLAEFGLVLWGLIMSVQLAIDFRFSEQRLYAMLTTAEEHAAELATMIEATLRVRDKLNTPLQTLELGLATRSAINAADEQTLADCRGAITYLTLLGRAVAHTTDQRNVVIAEKGRAA